MNDTHELSGAAELGSERAEVEPAGVLIVDNRPDNLLALSTILEAPGRRLVTAPAGREALHALLQQAFAVILLHVNMPLMDGFEVARLIRGRPGSASTPIIFVGADRDEETVARAYALGAVDYIFTPLNPQVLRAKVAVFVDLFAKSAHDIRARRQAEEALERKARQLAEANRMKDEFLAVLSHELRTPLNAIVGWTFMLQAAHLDGDQAHQALEAIARNGKAQLTLINEVLDVSRFVTGRFRLALGRVDLGLVMRAAADTVRPAAELKGINLEVETGDGVVWLRADAARLQQAIWNLLSNGVKFGRDGGFVRLSLERGDGVLLRVSDDGPGIERDLLPLVFDRFKQGDSSTARAYGGLGLGLAIVRQIVELHGGAVAAESEGLGRGATFTITLPSCLVLDAGQETRPVRDEPDVVLSDGVPPPRSERP